MTCEMDNRCFSFRSHLPRQIVKLFRQRNDIIPPLPAVLELVEPFHRDGLHTVVCSQNRSCHCTYRIGIAPEVHRSKHPCPKIIQMPESTVNGCWNRIHRDHIVAKFGDDIRIDTFTSIIAGFFSAIYFATSANSSIVAPKMLAITGTLISFNCSHSSSISL